MISWFADRSVLEYRRENAHVHYRRQTISCYDMLNEIVTTAIDLIKNRLQVWIAVCYCHFKPDKRNIFT